MDLSSRAIRQVIHPTAAFSLPAPACRGARAPAATAGQTAPSWLESDLNPKNRIDSLEPPADPRWRIDGCTGLGTQFYAVPLFLGGGPPMRFDVFLPEEVAQDPRLRQILDLDAAFHTKDALRVRRLGITSHILRALQAWTLRLGLAGSSSVASMYEDLPFGSRIIFENLDLDIRKIRIVVARMYQLERHMLPLPRLHDALGLPSDALPQPLDISRLRVVQQLSDSVCLVRISPTSGPHPAGRQNHGLWVMKALTSSTKYLYHELRVLLKLRPHPNIISRPAFLVTKNCRFGGKTAVVGFVTPFHPGGGLRDLLPLLRIHGRLRLADQLRWATQLASAVLHIRERGGTFYPDLRLDNVVLSDASDVTMVDFEQRGVWCEFSAPEVNAFDYVRILASDGPPQGVDAADANGSRAAPPDPDLFIPADVRARYAVILARHVSAWETLQLGDHYMPLPPGCDNYNIPWLCLSGEEEREAAEVYMLGRVLWCIFEGQSSPQLGAVWQSYQLEPDLEFPSFRRTPPQLRDLIDACTRGRRQPLSAAIIRLGNKLVLREVPAGQPQDAERVRLVATDWWAQELEFTEDFLRKREELAARGEWTGNYWGRPTMRVVLAELEALGKNMTGRGLQGPSTTR